MTLQVYGTIDEAGEDETVYDHVILAADVGAVQNIFTQTLNNYQDNEQVKTVVGNCIDKNIGQMKIAPDYRVSQMNR